MARGERGDTATQITLIGLGLNLALTAAKFATGVITGSVALLADGIHSLSDLVTDLVVLGGLRLSQRPADASHAYGHGKFETVATAMVALALFAAGGWIAVEALLALTSGAVSIPGPLVAAVAAVSVVSKEWLFRATRRVARELRSSSLEANAWHHRSDALSSVAVLVGGVMASAGITQGDQVAAIAVAVLIGWAAARILRRAIYELTEGALPAAEQGRVAQAISEIEGVLSWHKLRTRYAGRAVLVDVHIQVDPSLSVAESHRIASRVERGIRDALGCEASVVIHVEPAEEPTSA